MLAKCRLTLRHSTGISISRHRSGLNRQPHTSITLCGMGTDTTFPDPPSSALPVTGACTIFAHPIGRGSANVTVFVLAHHPAAQVAYVARIDAVYYTTTTSIPLFKES